jgi:acetyl-CoA carboxylase biotin carboxylase subunit
MQEHGIKFIEPEMIDRMGDKASAKATMIEAYAVVPGSVGVIRTSELESRSLLPGNA